MVTVVVLLLAVVIVGLGLYAAARSRRPDQTSVVEALRRAAQALGGTVTRAPNGTFQLDALVAGQQVHIGYQLARLYTAPIPELYAEVDVPDHASQLDVHPKATPPHPDHPSTLNTDAVGDESFDAAYEVLSCADVPTPALLPPEARRLMVESGPVVVHLADGRLEVRRSTSMIDAPTVLNLARIAGLSARVYT